VSNQLVSFVSRLDLCFNSEQKMNSDSVKDLIATRLDREVLKVVPLSGGCISQVFELYFRGGERRVFKTCPPKGHSRSLSIEAEMLRYLKSKTKLPVPTVQYSAQDFMILEHIPSDPISGEDTEVDAAMHLSQLHQVRSEHFGFACSTVLAGIELDNQPAISWVDFFRSQRLLPFANLALNSGRIGKRTNEKLQSLASNLKAFIQEPKSPALIHGDVWSGNVLFCKGKVAAFLDPAIYFAHPEMELAFIRLFNTFGQSFFDAYQAESGTLEEGFFEVRSDIYNLIPLLVHAILFGGSYANSIDQVLMKLGISS
jgi:fructosamine-3-kinase